MGAARQQKLRTYTKRGRPRKAAWEAKRPVNITLDPVLHEKAKACARACGGNLSALITKVLEEQVMLYELKDDQYIEKNNLENL